MKKHTIKIYINKFRLIYYKRKLKKSNNNDLKSYFINIIKYSSFFNEEYYKLTYNIASDPCLHYLETGYKLGYNASLDFQTNIYYDFNPDVKDANINPLLHYELYGKKEGRQSGTPIINQGIYYPQKIKRFILRYFSRFLNYSKIKRNNNCRILVILHLFYIKSVDEIIEYLKNLNDYNYDLIVTYIDGMYYPEALNKIKKFKPTTQFRKYDNKGFDIGPFLDIIHNLNLEKYDIIIKLQTKNTSKSNYSYKMFFKNRDWFLNLFNGILGSFTVHKTIDILYNYQEYGLVAAKNLITSDPIHKQNLVFKSAPIKPKNKNYQFVCGSCFAIKTACLKTIQNLNLTINNFKIVKRGYFTYAHIMERVVCYVVENENYRFYGNKVDYIRHFKYNKIEKQLQKLSALNIFENENIKGCEDIIIKIIEGSFAKNYETMYIRLKDIQGSNILEQNCFKEIKNDEIDKFILVIDQNNKILNDLKKISNLQKRENQNIIVKILKINFVSLNINNIKPFSKIKLK